MAKRKIEAVQIDDLNVTIETKEIKSSETNKIKKAGRPKKFANKKDVTINIYLSQGQSEAIDNRLKEIGFSVRQDYFRKLLRADIENFDEL